MTQGKFWDREEQRLNRFDTFNEQKIAHIFAKICDADCDRVKFQYLSVKCSFV